jgi:fatty-acyl-CoA synthase
MAQTTAAGPGGVHRSPAKAWLRALELTAPIAAQPHRLLFDVIEERARSSGDAPALLSADERLSYRVLAARANRYTRLALAQGISKGDAVCLLMSNRPEYMAIWLGIIRAGGVVALLNTQLTGSSLRHAVDLVMPAHIIVAVEHAGALAAALPDPGKACRIWVHGAGHDRFPRIDLECERHDGAPLESAERPQLSIEDRALYIYTSGTTGLPKAANITHGRLMQWSHWFAGMMDTGPGDRMYNVLPMYHSVGGVLATGAVLVGGGSVVIRDGFAARRFWEDILEWDCTLFQYIGELCRYLLRTDRHPRETGHRIRMCCGNGLRPDIWNEFRERFRIPRIFEFYAATEGNVSLFNIEGKAGAIGRIPPYLGHRFAVELVRFDVEKEVPVRDERGFCTRCDVNETGEAIGKIGAGSSNIGSRFDGYTSRDATERKILRDVFERGDAWFRTGDLMRKDGEGCFYFVDRVGDTFRWKGENVATSEVAEALCAFPGISEANVYGVPVPGADGRAGMAALVTDGELDLAALAAHLAERLPAYARPVFLRVRGAMQVTGTFKHLKSDLVREGFDPAATSDSLFFNDPSCRAFVRLDEAIFGRIRAGDYRL